MAEVNVPTGRSKDVALVVIGVLAVWGFEHLVTTVRRVSDVAGSEDARRATTAPDSVYRARQRLWLSLSCLKKAPLGFLS